MSPRILMVTCKESVKFYDVERKEKVYENADTPSCTPITIFNNMIYLAEFNKLSSKITILK
jgi:hypothetical protein